ncbi:hypothetical protein SAMN04487969_10652 [Paenibacillus algorifonticola]|uniref:Uncharacterized protein n=1 Tax=Paenibacillus algorifonticola TaxID=684063 RepID=A0A1I2D208_9BACL|nr:hypothetical protein [Paenibacillus algorifonticola]SFE74515.1 hypothetical protein SAMN04487969_10652 [Paenibacillus algorifonticola]
MTVNTNQNQYLTNMAAGKTAAGGTANAGQQAWAKAQLAKSSIPSSTTAANTTNATSQTNTLEKKKADPILPDLRAKSGSSASQNPGTGIFTPVVPKVTPVPAPTTTQPTPSFSTPQYNDWQAKSAQQYAALESLTGTPFSYDPETDAGYQAQRQLAQIRAGDASKSAMETANEKGILNSSLTSSQLGQIQQRAEQEAVAYIPEYRQQAYAQYQDRLANAANLLNTARALRGDQFNESVTEAGLTGNYMPAGSQQLIQQLIGLKQQAETKGITATDRAQLSGQADVIRSQLQAMGVNTSTLGANVSAANVTANPYAGTRTLAGQEMDLANKQSNWNAYMDMVGQTGNLGSGPTQTWGSLAKNANVGQQTLAGKQYDRGVFESDRAYNYTAGRDAVSDKQWLDQFNEQVRQFGMQNALQWAAQNLNEQQYKDNSARQWAGLDWEMSQTNSSAYNGMNLDQAYGAISRLYGTPVLDSSGQPTGKNTMPTNATDREKMYTSAIDLGLPETQTDQLLLSLGFSKDELSALNKKHGVTEGK